jgi:hypothetical protein
MFLATQTPPDLIGYQFKGTRNWDGQEVSITDPTVPLWMITHTGKPTWAYKRGLLFLDEYGQGEADVKRASAELLLNKRIGPWTLGGENSAGWGVVAASNHMGGRNGVTKGFDFVINRRKQIVITDDLESLLEWMDEHDISPTTKAFASQNPESVFMKAPEDKQGPWMTPRSLVMLDKVLQAKMRRTGGAILPDDANTIESSAGLVGAPAAASYFSFLKLEADMPKYETIVAGPTKAKLPTKPDSQMLTCYHLAHRVSKADIQPVIEYVSRLPKEMAVTFCKAACKRDNHLVGTQAVQKWAQTNASLMAAIAN